MTLTSKHHSGPVLPSSADFRAIAHHRADQRDRRRQEEAVSGRARRPDERARSLPVGMNALLGLVGTRLRDDRSGLAGPGHLSFPRLFRPLVDDNRATGSRARTDLS